MREGVCAVRGAQVTTATIISPPPTSAVTEGTSLSYRYIQKGVVTVSSILIDPISAVAM